MHNNKIRLSIHIITYIVVSAFLYSNIVWAGPSFHLQKTKYAYTIETEKLSKDTALGEKDFILLLGKAAALANQQPDKISGILNQAEALLKAGKASGSFDSQWTEVLEPPEFIRWIRGNQDNILFCSLMLKLYTNIQEDPVKVTELLKQVNELGIDISLLDSFVFKLAVDGDKKGPSHDFKAISGFIASGITLYITAKLVLLVLNTSLSPLWLATLTVAIAGYGIWSGLRFLLLGYHSWRAIYNTACRQSKIFAIFSLFYPIAISYGTHIDYDPLAFPELPEHYQKLIEEHEAPFISKYLKWLNDFPKIAHFIKMFAILPLANTRGSIIKTLKKSLTLSIISILAALYITFFPTNTQSAAAQTIINPPPIVEMVNTPPSQPPPILEEAVSTGYNNQETPYPSAGLTQEEFEGQKLDAALWLMKKHAPEQWDFLQNNNIRIEAGYSSFAIAEYRQEPLTPPTITIGQDIMSGRSVAEIASALVHETTHAMQLSRYPWYIAEHMKAFRLYWLEKGAYAEEDEFRQEVGLPLEHENNFENCKSQYISRMPMLIFFQILFDVFFIIGMVYAYKYAKKLINYIRRRMKNNFFANASEYEDIVRRWAEHDEDIIVEQFNDIDTPEGLIWGNVGYKIVHDYKKIMFINLGSIFLVDKEWGDEAPSDIRKGNFIYINNLTWAIGDYIYAYHTLNTIAGLLLTGGDIKDKTVLDMGAGSGILGLAALKLGAKKVIGIENDKKLIRALKANFQVNGYGEEKFLIFDKDILQIDNIHNLLKDAGDKPEIAVCNIGPTNKYYKRANDKAVNLVGEYPAIGTFTGGGYYGEKGRYSYRKTVAALGKYGFRRDISVISQPTVKKPVCAFVQRRIPEPEIDTDDESKDIAGPSADHRVPDKKTEHTIDKIIGLLKEEFNLSVDKERIKRKTTEGIDIEKTVRILQAKCPPDLVFKMLNCITGAVSEMSHPAAINLIAAILDEAADSILAEETKDILNYCSRHIVSNESEESPILDQSIFLLLSILEDTKDANLNTMALTIVTGYLSANLASIGAEKLTVIASNIARREKEGFTDPLEYMAAKYLSAENPSLRSRIETYFAAKGNGYEHMLRKAFAIKEMFFNNIHQARQIREEVLSRLPLSAESDGLPILVGPSQDSEIRRTALKVLEDKILGSEEPSWKKVKQIVAETYHRDQTGLIVHDVDGLLNLLTDTEPLRAYRDKEGRRRIVFPFSHREAGIKDAFRFFAENIKSGHFAFMAENKPVSVINESGETYSIDTHELLKMFMAQEFGLPSRKVHIFSNDILLIWSEIKNNRERYGLSREIALNKQLVFLADEKKATLVSEDVIRHMQDNEIKILVKGAHTGIRAATAICFMWLDLDEVYNNNGELSETALNILRKIGIEEEELKEITRQIKQKGFFILPDFIKYTELLNQYRLYQQITDIMA